MELKRTMDTQDEIVEKKIIQLQEDLVNMGFTTLGPLAAMELFLMFWEDKERDKEIVDMNYLKYRER